MGGFQSHLKFSNKNINTCKTFGKVFSGLSRQKSNFWEGLYSVISGVKLPQHFIKRKSYEDSNAGVMSRGCFVMVLGFFAASGQFSFLDIPVRSALYQKFLKENLWSSVCEMKLTQTWVMQPDPKLTAKSNP